MDRNARTLLVVGVALVLASLSTWLVYKAIQSRPAQQVEVATAYAVVASRPLALGAMVTADDVKLVPWPAANVVPGSFDNVEAVMGRGVVSPINENEPLTDRNLASPQAGAGLPPTIPPGMRAVSVRVNEVVGVAGFVVPGTRVDVIGILTDAANNSMARVVVSNVQVLAAGTKYDQEVAREGQAMPTTVVTLLVKPEDAERISLAANEGQIMLTLRNPLDTAETTSTGIRASALATGAPAPAPAGAAPVARPRPAAPPPPPPPAEPEPYSVEVIRGAVRSEETLK